MDPARVHERNTKQQLALQCDAVGAQRSLLELAQILNVMPRERHQLEGARKIVERSCARAPVIERRPFYCFRLDFQTPLSLASNGGLKVSLGWIAPC